MRRTSWSAGLSVSADGVGVVAHAGSFTGHGQSVTVPLTQDDGSLVTPANPLDTGIPAVPGHYSTTELMGFSAPGISANIQVAFKPAH